jgi:hypothetical protein
VRFISFRVQSLGHRAPDFELRVKDLGSGEKASGIKA